MALRDLVVSVLFQDNASGGLNNINNNATGLGKTLTGVAATLGGIFALGKMKDLAIDMVEAAGEAEALNAQFETVFDTLQDDANASINAMAEEFGMLPSRLQPTFTKTTSMFKGFGMSTEDSMEAAGKSVELAADAAAFYDVAMKDADGALTSFLKGNTNAAESIGIFATAAGMASFASDKLGLNWKTLDEGGRQLVRLKYVESMQEAAGATGQAAREADGYENVLGNLQQSWVDLKAKLGMAIFDVAIDGMKSLASWMSSINTDGIVKNLKVIGRYMTETFGPAFNTIKEVAGSAIGVVKSFGKTIADSWNSIKGVVTPVIKALATFAGVITTISASSLIFSAVFAGIGAVIMFLTSPIALVAAGVTALVLGFQAAYKYSEPFRDSIDGIVGSIKGFFMALQGASSTDLLAEGLWLGQAEKIHAFADNVRGAVKKVGTVFKGLAALGDKSDFKSSFLLESVGFTPEVIAGLRSFVLMMKKTFDNATEFIAGFASAVMSGNAGNILEALGFSPEMISKVTDFVTGIKTTASELVEHLKTKWTEIQPSIMMLIENFVGLKDTAISIFTTLWSFLQPVFSAVGNALQIIADIAVMAFTMIIAPAVRFGITMFQTLWIIVGPILELLGAAIGAAFDILKVIWDTLLKPLSTWLLGTFVSTFEAMQGQLDTAAGSFSWLGDKISGVVDWFGRVTDAVKNFKVPDWLSRLGGGGTVKFEASEGVGGNVDGSHATGLARVQEDGYIAELHKDESVLTAGQSDSLRSMGILGSQGDLPVLNLPTGEGSPEMSSPISPIANSTSRQTVSKTENHNTINIHVSGENAKDIAAEVRREVENIFIRLNAGLA